MWLENKVFAEDMGLIASAPFISWEKLRGKTVLVTGATGLIGYALASALLYRGISVLALVPSPELASSSAVGVPPQAVKPQANTPASSNASNFFTGITFFPLI